MMPQHRGGWKHERRGPLRWEAKGLYHRRVDPRDDQEAAASAVEERSCEETSEPPQEGSPAARLIDLVLEAHEARIAEEPLPPVVEGVVIARVASVDAAGVVRVAYPGAPSEGAVARVMARVTEADVGREAALLFESGDRDKPIVMGLLFQGAAPAAVSRSGASASVDGERIVLSADKEIVLECGEASITLTRAGKILIKGTYVLSRSSGTNRIQGGSVQIN